ncbi:LacI family DNA-binding transcriptional regulator [Microbacterium yannicii]|uniref:LacI family DNA-binding transcriptional regulator n=1 Tax=Microbacterium yannicii TaxID=671622 RepID=UPI0002DCBED8|nr:LacI family DNA-binding transcriptional regulator [Microbacterium yannicii]
MSKRPTIYDVATAAGVSKSLVSLVLQGSDRVGAESRAAIEQAIADLGYRPSRAAAELAAGRTRLVGVLVDDYANPWFVELLRGLNHVLGPDGFRVTVVDSASGSMLEDPVEALLSMRADGIVVARDLTPVLVGAAAPPIVVAGTRANIPPGVDAVANDDRSGARLAAEHVLSLGHRRIAVLSAGGGAAVARAEGFVAAARAAGAAVTVTDYGGPATEDAGFDGALRVLESDRKTTALFAANDLMGIGALGAARRLALDVPAQLSIIGYDNTYLAQTRLIDLTTIDGNSFAVGREAGRRLAARIAGTALVGARVMLEPTLIRRGTTALAPSAVVPRD